MVGGSKSVVLWTAFVVCTDGLEWRGVTLIASLIRPVEFSATSIINDTTALTINVAYDYCQVSSNLV